MHSNQKHTPKKLALITHKKFLPEQAPSIDLLCPFAELFSPSFVLRYTYTPLRGEPEYLLSPSSIKKDLFSQLLGTETKSPVQLSQHNSTQQHIQTSQIMEQSESSVIWSSQNYNFNDGNNEIKKRRRKSTAQIKLLKQQMQLDGEANWNKEKIQRMAQLTGLSQSQVYKWCWDQKKKIYKSRQQGRCMRKGQLALINQDIADRGNNQKQSKELNVTKLKLASAIEVADGKTQKKVNKRLIFL